MEQATLEIDATRAIVGFFVPGKPQTAGSKTAVVNRHTGRAVVIDSANPEAKERKRAWRTDVRDMAQAAAEACGWQKAGADVPLSLTVGIVRERPSAHFGSGRNAGRIKQAKLNAKPTTRPDTIKLVRAIEDALTGVLWHDDSQIVEHMLTKGYGECEGAYVTVAAVG